MVHVFNTTAAFSTNGFPISLRQEYNDLTKEILLTGIDLERFSLNYRLEASKQSVFKYLRYGLAQQAGATGGLAFEVVGVREFDKGRRNPLKVNVPAVNRALKGAEITGIIAGAGSAFELAANSLQAIRSYYHGYDSRSATNYVATHAKRLDELIAKHEALVKAHPDHPAYKAALAEVEVLKTWRDATLSEYSQFHTHIRAYRTYENLFYALNIATNVTGVLSSHYGVKGLSNAKFNGPSSILFIVSGALTIVSPLISSTVGTIEGKLAQRRFYHKLGYKPLNYASRLQSSYANLQAQVSSVNADEQKYPNAVAKASSYEQKADAFNLQLKTETKVFRYLTNTAVQSDIFGPAIGGTLLAQGILSAQSYYKYNLSPRKALNLNYQGAVAGAAGTAVAVGGTAAGILSLYYQYYRLYKRKRLPRQIIEARLQQLDEFEQSVRAL